MGGSGRAEFRVLGSLEVMVGGREVSIGASKQRMLLAALLVRANTVTSVDALLETLWADEPPDHAASTLA